MSKTNVTENKLLQLIFNAVNWASLASATGVTNLYVALHTADPGGGGGGYTPEQIADAVRAELETELGRIDVSISTREAEIKAWGRAFRICEEIKKASLLIPVTESLPLEG